MSSITDEDRKFVETWENIAEHQNAIVRLDRRGDDKPEIVFGRRTFHITTEERLITSEKVIDPQHDPFRNGDFRPIIIPEDLTIETNPNALSDEQILDILSSSQFAWEEWLNNIDSPATLRRMVVLAEQSEELSYKRFRQLTDRLTVVKPRTRIQSNDPEVQKFLRDQGTPARKHASSV